MTFQDRDQLSSRVCVGKIASAHGVKGLVKVLPFTKDLNLLKRVYSSEDGSETLELVIKNPLGKYVLAEIQGVTDRNAAEALSKCSLFVPRETAATADDIFYIIRMRVVSGEAGNLGAEIGVVKGVENYGAGDLLDIQLNTGKSVMVPLTPDFVTEIDDVVTVVNYEAFL